MQAQKKQKQKNPKQTIQHPLFGISPFHWISLVKKNGGIDTSFLHKALFITIASICIVPIRLLFKIKYQKEIQNQKLHHPPIFIIGHWRSGTTYLHELLSKDPQFCYTSLWHTLLPDSCLLLEPVKAFLSRFLPAERPMDQIKVDMDGPYEDEAGLAVLLPWSFFHCLHFPRNAEEQYCQSIHFQGLSPVEKNHWKNRYLRFIQLVVYANHGKQFISKNPPNTARISTLLEIFPDAKFIHIYRNPYLVYLSTKKMRRRVLDKLALQNGSEKEIEKQIIDNYIRLMNSFFEQKKLIKDDRFVEIRYEDLIRDPLEQVTYIYQTLHLSGLTQAVPEMEKYLRQQSDYKTNVYKIDEKILKHVEENWKFTLYRWRYQRPK